MSETEKKPEIPGMMPRVTDPKIALLMHITVIRTDEKRPEAAMTTEKAFLWAVKSNKARSFMNVPMTSQLPFWLLPTALLADPALVQFFQAHVKSLKPDVNFDDAEIVPVVVEVREISKEEMIAHQKA